MYGLKPIPFKLKPVPLKSAHYLESRWVWMGQPQDQPSKTGLIGIDTGSA